MYDGYFDEYKYMIRYLIFKNNQNILIILHLFTNKIFE